MGLQRLRDANYQQLPSSVLAKLRLLTEEPSEDVADDVDETGRLKCVEGPKLEPRVQHKKQPSSKRYISSALRPFPIERQKLFH